MPDTTPPMKVSANAGLIDTLTAAGRYAVAIATALPILLTVLGTRDVLSWIEYFRSTDGSQLIAAVVGLGTILYGLWKTRGRGVQVAQLAVDPRVPNSIIQPK